MPNFKIGDSVRITETLGLGKIFDGTRCYHKTGDTGSIVEVAFRSQSYKIRLDDSCYDSRVHLLREPWVESCQVESVHTPAVSVADPVWVEKIHGRKDQDIPDILTIQAHERGEAGVRRITRTWPYKIPFGSSQIDSR